MVFKAKTLMIALALTLLALPPATAGDVQVQAKVDRTRIAAGEPLRLSVTLRGGPGTVDLSGLTDFDVASQASSTNIQLINGRLSKEIRYDYSLIPQKAGRLTIPALPVKTDDGVLHTDPISVEVTDQPEKGDDRADVFVEAEISTPTPYAGQQLIYRFRFFNAVQVADNVRFQKPDFSGFTVRKVEKERVFQQTVNGRTYQVTELVFVLIALNSGDATIDPAVIQCQVFQKGGAGQDPLSRLSPFFEDRFFARRRAIQRTLRTPAIPLTVKPLPPVPPDVPFSGLVGRFDIKAEIDRLEIPAGESVTLTVTVAGEGNVMDAPAPGPGPVSDAKVYADTPEDELAITDQGISGEKRFRFAVVPVRAGDLNLPAVEIGFFDPSAGRYQRVKSRPIHVRVLASTESETATTALPPVPDELPAIQKKPVTFSGRDILPLKESLDAIADSPALSPLAFGLWMSGPVLIYLVIVAVLAGMNRTETERQKMARQAREQIRRAAGPTLSDADYLAALYTALMSAIHSLGDKQGACLTGAETRCRLADAGHADDEIVSVVELIERVEAARFGGRALGAGERKALLKETRDRVEGLCR